MITNDNESLKLLFNLGVAIDNDTSICNTPKKSLSETDDNFVDPDPCIDAESTAYVPDVFNEFSDIVDTNVFKQPFSLRKYKHLIPKTRSKRKSTRERSPTKQKQKNTSTANESEETCPKIISLDEPPWSPSLSIDSAVDLSADIHSLQDSSGYSKFSTTEYPQCQCYFMDENSDKDDRISSKTVLKNSLKEELHKNYKTRIKKYGYSKRKAIKQTILDEDQIIQVAVKKPRLELNPKSLLDVIATDLSIPIPIELKSYVNLSFSDKQTQVDVTFDGDDEDKTLIVVPYSINSEEINSMLSSSVIYIPNLIDINNFDDDIPIVRQNESEKVECSANDALLCGHINLSPNLINIHNLDADISLARQNESNEINPKENDNLTGTLKNLEKDESCKDVLTKLPLTTNNSKSIGKETMELENVKIISLTDDIALRTYQFIVDDNNDDKLPENLISELEYPIKDNDVNERDAKIKSHFHNFHLNLLRMYCAGIVDRDDDIAVDTTIFNRRKYCAQKICSKYKKYRAKNFKKYYQKHSTINIIPKKDANRR